MLIASKYEEMYAPEVSDFVFITDTTYTSFEIRQMERQMLQLLDYSLGNPLCLHFLRRYSRAGEVGLLLTFNSLVYSKGDPSNSLIIASIFGKLSQQASLICLDWCQTFLWSSK